LSEEKPRQFDLIDSNCRWPSSKTN